MKEEDKKHASCTTSQQPRCFFFFFSLRIHVPTALQCLAMGKRRGGGKRTPRSQAAKGSDDEEDVEDAPQRLVRDEFTIDELQDEVDRVYEQRHRMPEEEEDEEKDEGGSDGSDVEQVMKLRGVDSDEDEEDEEDEEDMDTANVLGLDREDPDAEAERIAARWGKQRGAYYNTDFVDPDFMLEEADEEAARQEEEEAVRLQRRAAERLAADDFGPLLQSTLSKAAETAAARKAAQRTAAIAVPKDVTAMTAEERLEVLASTAPELLDLIEQLQEQHAFLTGVIEPLVAREQDLSPDASHVVGLYQTLVPVYLLNIVFYLHLHASGAPTPSAHPCLETVVSLRRLLASLETRAAPLRLATLLSRLDAKRKRKSTKKQQQRRGADDADEAEWSDVEDDGAEQDEAQHGLLRYSEPAATAAAAAGPTKNRKRKRVCPSLSLSLFLLLSLSLFSSSFSLVVMAFSSIPFPFFLLLPKNTEQDRLIFFSFSRLLAFRLGPRRTLTTRWRR
jgi:U3 small nucleolar RNA-associated protein 3